MRDEDLIKLAEQQSAPTENHKFTIRNVSMFAIVMAAMWFIGSILTPLFPDELIAMLIYAVLFYWLGFDPTTLIAKFFKKQ